MPEHGTFEKESAKRIAQATLTVEGWPTNLDGRTGNANDPPQRTACLELTTDFAQTGGAGEYTASAQFVTYDAVTSTLYGINTGLPTVAVYDPAAPRDGADEPTAPPTVGTGARIWATYRGRWEMVSAVTTGTAKAIEFELASTLETTDASQASCTVDAYYYGDSPGATVTVYNKAASSDYVFEGASGNKGMALYNETAAKYVIWQMECP